MESSFMKNFVSNQDQNNSKQVLQPSIKQNYTSSKIRTKPGLKKVLKLDLN